MNLNEELDIYRSAVLNRFEMYLPFENEEGERNEFNYRLVISKFIENQIKELEVDVILNKNFKPLRYFNLYLSSLMISLVELFQTIKRYDETNQISKINIFNEEKYQISQTLQSIILQTIVIDENIKNKNYQLAFDTLDYFNNTFNIIISRFVKYHFGILINKTPLWEDFKKAQQHFEKYRRDELIKLLPLENKNFSSEPQQKATTVNGLLYIHHLYNEMKNNLEGNEIKFEEKQAQPPQQDENSKSIVVKNELHNDIFKDNAFEFWQSMFDKFQIEKSSRADINFMFQVMKYNEQIHDHIGYTDIEKWINKVYEITFERIIFTNINENSNKKRLIIYNGITSK